MSVRSERWRNWLVVGTIAAGAACALAAGGTAGLPEKALATVRSAFPGAVIKGYEVERENTLVLYGVQLTHERKAVEVEVTEEGMIGEIETLLRPEQLPDDIADAIKAAIGNGRIVQVEKHEVRAVPRRGRLYDLERPMLVFEVDFYVGNIKRRAQIRTVLPLRLPQQAKAAIQAEFPGALIEEFEVEHEMGLKLYEVQIQHGGKTLEVQVSPDGVVVAVESLVSVDDLPQAVAEAITKATQGAKLVELEKEEVRAVPRLVVLDVPDVTYGVEFVKDGRRREIEFTAGGLAIDEDEGNGDDDNHEGDDD